MASAAALLAVALGVIVVAVAAPALAQTPDPHGPLALYDSNENGQIDADEFILAFADYLDGRIDATLLMRVRRLYLSTTATGASQAASSQEGFWYDACDDYDGVVEGTTKDRKIDRDEVIQAINDYLFNETITRATVLTVIECYLSTTAHMVRFAATTYSVNEGSSVDITLEMSLPYGTSTIDVPIEVVGGSAGSGDFSFTQGAGATTTATFAAGATTTEFAIKATGDTDDESNETVILSFGVFSTSTVPMDVHPSSQMGTTTVTIVEPPEPPPPTNSAPTVSINTSGQMVNGGQEVSLDATASDPDGDSLTYNWSASSGSFEDYLALDTTWTAPAAQSSDLTYRLTITVSDGSLTASSSVSFTVRRVSLGEPQNVTYSLTATSGTVIFEWDQASNATGYQVRQCKRIPTKPNSCNYTVVETIQGGSVTTATVTGIDTTYNEHEFRIRATRSLQYRDSRTITVRLKPAPQDMKGVYKSGQYGKITLTWNPVPNPDVGDDLDAGYHVAQLFGSSDWKRLTAIPQDGATIGSIVSENNNLKVVVSGLEPGRDYSHRVRAESVQGLSEPSNVATTTVEDERPKKPPAPTVSIMLANRGIKVKLHGGATGATSHMLRANPSDSTIAFIDDGSSSSIPRDGDWVFVAADDTINVIGLGRVHTT